ncbi:MAG: phenylalanine--tRNA ligase subunit beta, partial [Dehalococcoidia bacterium]|nr:phenylalanine--tRNA ligase subunit beta [Dehalococcoidia bacterium]
MSGPRREKSWRSGEGALDFFDAKGVVESLLERLGFEADFKAEREESLHSGRAARIVAAGEVIGIVGELHPRVAESFELLPQPVALFEIEVERLLPYATRRKYRPLPRFPSSVRDLAIVVDEEVPAKKIEEVIRSSPLVSQTALFDLYTGEPVPAGKKSLAFRVVYQSPTHTLTDEEVDKVEEEILARLSREMGATLRRR